MDWNFNMLNVSLAILVVFKIIDKEKAIKIHNKLKNKKVPKDFEDVIKAIEEAI